MRRFFSLLNEKKARAISDRKHKRGSPFNAQVVRQGSIWVRIICCERLHTRAGAACLDELCIRSVTCPQA